jgi:hypothetical protein
MAKLLVTSCWSLVKIYLLLAILILILIQTGGSMRGISASRLISRGTRGVTFLSRV